jgi:transposase
MSHANAPLTPASRLRLVQRCATRPIAHVAAEAGISRQCLSKWKARYDDLGEVGLLDRASMPGSSPTQLDPQVVEQIERLRREHKWTARQIHLQLTRTGQRVSLATVSRWHVSPGVAETDRGSALRRSAETGVSHR